MSLRAHLTSLRPRWIAGQDEYGILRESPDRAGARAVEFDCPACLLATKTGGRGIRGHRVLARFVPVLPGAPDGWPASETWRATGETFGSLTLEPSVDGTGIGDCRFHGWVRLGEVTW